MATVEEMLNTYSEETVCVYKDETYKVRDNGAVFRCAREGKRMRKDDEVWTFGNKDEKTGYMKLGTHRVHIIVANAFLGVNDSTKLVVDHKDTNRCNNRKENLRWITRLENVLLNPVTYKKVKFLCGGDIIRFIKDPTVLRSSNPSDADVTWMRTVMPDEAINSLRNVLQWASYDHPIHADYKISSRDKYDMSNLFKKNAYGSYVYESPEFTKAIYPEGALQKDWYTPCEFVLCPVEVVGDPLECYLKNLRPGARFLKNRYGENNTIIDAAYLADRKGLVVFSTNPDAAKNYFLCYIYYSGGQYIHESMGSYFTEDGGRKRFVLAQGLEWNGPDSVDDYC